MPAVVPCGRTAGSRPCGLAATGRARGWRPCWQPPLRVGRNRSRPRVAGSPLMGGLGCNRPPLQGGLAMASRPLVGGLGRSRLPLAASHAQPLLLAVLAVNALNGSTQFNLITHSLKPIFRTKILALIPLLGNLSEEIVYPCILDPNGEDEGGQASSSIAAKNPWHVGPQELVIGLGHNDRGVPAK
ncbi:hypothetical protein BHE74_00022376 [Ensete ventricosum]|nr:hypothetical protein BHE74_00022376 [Ensete ventricosum]